MCLFRHTIPTASFGVWRCAAAAASAVLPPDTQAMSTKVQVSRAFNTWTQERTFWWLIVEEKQISELLLLLSFSWPMNFQLFAFSPIFNLPSLEHGRMKSFSESSRRESFVWKLWKFSCCFFFCVKCWGVFDKNN